jgi:DNA-binding PadR family transcriptional regulator
MKGTHLGEFEELIMLIVGVLFPDAYGLGIKHEVSEQTRRSAAIGAVHSALSRLEEKGFLKSHLDDATSERGGRRKKLYEITAEGKKALDINRSLRNTLWNKITKLGFVNIIHCLSRS